MFTSQKIDKQFILERLSEEEIIEFYLKIQIEFNKLILNPLRSDRNPTLTIKKYPNCIWIKDWSGSFQGNCFDLVKLIYNVNFYKACEIIASDFSLIKKDKTIVPKRVEWKEHIVKEKVKIEIKRRGWESYDLLFWSSIGITLNTLKKYYVYPLKVLWINSAIQYYFKNQYNLAYAYYFFNEEFKIYFPNQNKFRFRCNTNVLQGELQLPYEGPLLVITKSMKEVMLFHEYGIAAVAPQSESVILTQEQYDNFQKRFEYIVSNYDFDLAGIRSANKMKKLYGIEPFFLTTGKFNTIDYKAKDVTDYRKIKGEKETNKLITKFLSLFDL